MKPAKNISWAVVMMATIALAGCMQESPMTADQALRPRPREAIHVPPGAQIIAFGHYPLASFVVPHDGGMIYVFDVDAGDVAFVTSYPPDSTAAAAPQDLGQLSKNSLDTTHSYRVYYLAPPTTAASRPTDGGQ